MIQDLVTYDALIHGVETQNELEADARYWAERAYGWNETDAESYCPVQAGAANLAAERYRALAAVNRQILDRALSIFNEHTELTVTLERDETGEWDLI